MFPIQVNFVWSCQEANTWTQVKLFTGYSSKLPCTKSALFPVVPHPNFYFHQYQVLYNEEKNWRETTAHWGFLKKNLQFFRSYSLLWN